MTVGKDRRFDQPGGSGSRGGNRGPLGQQEAVCGNAEGGVVMEAAPAAPLVVAEAQLLLELEIIALDQPAQLGAIHEPFNRGVDGQAREPELDGSRLVFRPFDEQPLLGPGLTAPGIAVGRADPEGGEARGQRLGRAADARSPPARP